VNGVLFYAVDCLYVNNIFTQILLRYKSFQSRVTLEFPRQ
jgi:hypothetical protein